MDNSGSGYGKPGFRNEDSAIEFVDLAAGFMWWIGEEDQEITRKLHTFNDYVRRFAQWTGEIPSSLSEQQLLEPFLGSANLGNQLQWPLITDRRKGYKKSVSFGLAEGLNCNNMKFRKGYLGLAPPGTQKDDIICVLLGCDMPLVIRKIGRLWSLVGCCYCYGIMNGEVLQDVKDRKAHFENIKLQ
jgi:hypothetical protein